MPTDNPKISAYVPQKVYDKFKEYKESNQLSMSQAATAIIAQFLQVEYIIERTTGETTLGGVTLARIEAIESRLDDLLKRVNYQETISKLPNFNEIIKSSVLDVEIEKDSEVESSITEEEQENDQSSLPLLLSSEPLTKIEVQGKLLVKRLNGVNASQLSTTKGKYKDDMDGFSKWLQKQDIDNIAWISLGDRKGYTPISELPSELQNKLLKWIADNSS